MSVPFNRLWRPEKKKKRKMLLMLRASEALVTITVRLNVKATSNDCGWRVTFLSLSLRLSRLLSVAAHHHAFFLVILPLDRPSLTALTTCDGPADELVIFTHTGLLYCMDRLVRLPIQTSSRQPFLLLFGWLLLYYYIKAQVICT